MKPFNLERALAGEPVVTRDRKKISKIFEIKKEFSRPIICNFDCGEKYYQVFYTKEGKFHTEENDISSFDLFMDDPIESENYYSPISMPNEFLSLTKYEKLLAFIREIEFTRAIIHKKLSDKLESETIDAYLSKTAKLWISEGVNLLAEVGELENTRNEYRKILDSIENSKGLSNE